jgi:hypothetical protein
MCEVETAASVQSVAPRDTGLEQLSSSLEFSMREIAPSLLRLKRNSHVERKIITVVDPDLQNFRPPRSGSVINCTDPDLERRKVQASAPDP